MRQRRAKRARPFAFGTLIPQPRPPSPDVGWQCVAGRKQLRKAGGRGRGGWVPLSGGRGSSAGRALHVIAFYLCNWSHFPSLGFSYPTCSRDWRWIRHFFFFFLQVLCCNILVQRGPVTTSAPQSHLTPTNPPVLVPREILEGGTADEEAGGITSAHSHISSILQDANSKLLQGEFTFCPGRRLHSQTPNMVA